MGRKRTRQDAGTGSSIGDRLVAKMKREAHGKTVNLGDFIAGRDEAEELQKTVASHDDLARPHTAHAAYVYAQNQASVLAEQLAALDEMAPLVEIVAQAEEAYLPGGPPMSPLTTSYFSCWALFDACQGPEFETIGDVILKVGAAMGVHPGLLRLIRLMQESRMGVYVHAGGENGLIALREIVTGAVCRAICPAGYLGATGELWYARVLPPPSPGGAEHVVLTTPYLLLKPGLPDWQAYFQRTLPEAPRAEIPGAYARHMKYGPSRIYWNDFVFEAYVNHRQDVIYLAGLPDVPESRPHSEVNSRLARP